LGGRGSCRAGSDRILVRNRVSRGLAARQEPRPPVPFANHVVHRLPNCREIALDPDCEVWFSLHFLNSWLAVWPWVWIGARREQVTFHLTKEGHHELPDGSETSMLAGRGGF